MLVSIGKHMYLLECTPSVPTLLDQIVSVLQIVHTKYVNARAYFVTLNADRHIVQMVRLQFTLQHKYVANI